MARAPALQAGGYGFESHWLHLVSEVKAVKTLVCEASNSGFNSRQTPLMEAVRHGRGNRLESGCG